MPNYCDFTMYMVGKEDEIKAVDKIFAADYNYNLKPEFIDSLGIINDDNKYLRDSCSLEYARKEAERLGNTDALDRLSDKNITKQDFEDIPDTKHMFRVFEYYQADELTPIEDYGGDLVGEPGTYLSVSCGYCAWSVVSCMTDDRLSYYSEAKERYPESIFMGTHLQEISQMYPDLKICIVSEEPGMGFSEILYANGGKIPYSDCEDQTMAFYSSVEEAKEDGIDIREDQVDENIYTKCAPWYEMVDDEAYLDRDYVFDVLNGDYNESSK